MNIKVHEIKKIVSSPVIIGLTVVFLLFNIITINQNKYLQEDIKIISNMISKFGYEIDNEMINNIQAKYKDSLKELNKITKEKVNKTYKSVSEFMASDEYYSNNYEDGVFTRDELEFFSQVALLDLYSNQSVSLVQSYEDINIMEMGERAIEAYGLIGSAANLAKENYKELENRFEEIKENKEHKNLFFLGQTYRMHSLLFRDIFSKCIYEIMILVVLITAYLINFEFDNKTNLLVYSTKRGRKNIKDKFTVCMLASLIVSSLILGITLSYYFTTFDYSEVLNVPITTAFNWEYELPYISLFNHKILERLILNILIVTTCSVIFTTIAFIICALIKNSYLVIFIFFILFGISLLILQVISNSSVLLIYSHYNVFQLIINPHMWFMDMGPFMLKNCEVITLVTNILVISTGAILTINRFKKEDIN